MQAYDRLQELGLKPDNRLNNILVQVCKMDPLSVVWNAK